MNKTTRLGVILLGSGIFLNIFERLIWPTVQAIPLGHPAKLPSLIALMACMILSPLLMLIGAVTSLVGLGKPKDNA